MGKRTVEPVEPGTLAFQLLFNCGMVKGKVNPCAPGAATPS